MAHVLSSGNPDLGIRRAIRHAWLPTAVLLVNVLDVAFEHQTLVFFLSGDLGKGTGVR
jgi:hypothetical protein